MSANVRIAVPPEVEPANVSSNVGPVPTFLNDGGSAESNLPWQLLGEYTGPVESVLPREFRQRLHKHFARIERDFEREYRRLYGDNLALQERLEKFEDGDHCETTTLAKKLGASLLSQRIKQQYKQSTSRLVSSLRQSAGHSSGAGLIPSPATACAAANTTPVSTVTTAPGSLVTTCQTAGVAAVPFSGSLTGHTGSSWQLVHRIVGQHRDGIWEVTPYRRFLATASADSTVRLWSNDSQLNCIMIYVGHMGSVNSVRFRSRDHLLLTSSGDGTAHLIRIPFDLLVKASNSLSATQPTCAVSTSTTTGTSSSMTASEAIEAATTALTADMAGSVVKHGCFTGLTHEPDTSLLSSAYYDSGEAESLLARPAATGAAAGSPITPIHLRHPHAVFQSANLCASMSINNGASGLAPTASDISSAPLSAADFLTGREQLVTAGWDRLGRIYDLATGQEVSSLTGHDHQLTDVHCAPGGAPMVVTSSRDCTFRVWDFRQPGMRVNVQQAHNQPVSTTHFVGGGSGASDRLISAGADRFCRLWDLRQTRGPLFSVRTDASINRLAISGNTQHNDPITMCASVFGDPGNPEVSTTNSSTCTTVAGAGEANVTGTGLLNSTTGGRIGVGQTSSLIGSSWSTSHTRLLALPLDNRAVKFFDLNGNRIGSLTRSSSRSHSRMVTSVGWADEGVCNFFSVGFDSRLLGWQIHYS